MIRFPIYSEELRALVAAVWSARTPADYRSAYSHMLWADGRFWAFQEERSRLVTWKPCAHTVFTDLLGTEPVLLDYEPKSHELSEVEDGCNPWTAEYVIVCAVPDGDEVSRHVIPSDLAPDIAMHAVRELTGGFVSMKQLAPMKRLPLAVVIVKVDGVVLIGPQVNVQIRHRPVKKPRVSAGYVKYLGEYPEDGRVIL